MKTFECFNIEKNLLTQTDDNKNNIFSLLFANSTYCVVNNNLHYCQDLDGNMPNIVNFIRKQCSQQLNYYLHTVTLGGIT